MEINLVCGTNFHLIENLITEIKNNNNFEFERIDAQAILKDEILNRIPQKNVLFVSNHQTYFADVVAMFHVFNAGLSGRVDSIKNIGYLWKPKLNTYFVEAK